MEQQYKQPKEEIKLELKDLNEAEEKIPFKKVNCPSCDSPVPASNLNLDHRVAKCGECDVIFPLNQTIESFHTKEVKKLKQEIDRPEGVDLFSLNNELDITLKQPLLDGEILAMAFIPMFAFLYIFIGLMGADKFDLPTWSFYLATVIGLLPFWHAARRKEHKLHLSVDNEFLSIRWRPKKGVQDKHYHVQDIDQLYVKKFGGGFYLYMIVNGFEGQKHVALVPKILSVSKARYLEQEIERHLGIVDREVPEENA